MKKILFIISCLLLPVCMFGQTNFTWTGASNANWNLPGNWTRVPNLPIVSPNATNHHVIIPATLIGSRPWPIVNGSFTIGTLTINTPGVVITAPRIAWSSTATLSVNGTWTNDITEAHGGLDAVVSSGAIGIIRFRGSNTSFIGVNKFRSVVLWKAANTNTLTIPSGSKMQIVDNLNPHLGTCTVSTGGSLKLLASDGSTAYINGTNVAGIGTPSGSVLGSVTVSLFMPQYSSTAPNRKGDTCVPQDFSSVDSLWFPKKLNVCNNANFRYFGSPVNDKKWYRQLIDNYLGISLIGGAITALPTSGNNTAEIYPMVFLNNARTAFTTFSWRQFFNDTYHYNCMGGTSYLPVWTRYVESEGDPRPVSPVRTDTARFCENDSLGDDMKYGYRGITDGYDVADRMQGLLCHGEIRGTDPSRGDRILTWDGTVNNDTVSGLFTRTDNKIGLGTVSESANGVNIAGNPYPSGLDWNAVYADSVNSNLINFEKVLSIWHNNGSLSNMGSTLSWNPVAGTGDAMDDGNISIGQGFWVRPLNIGSTRLFFRNQYRSNVTNISFGRKATTKPVGTFGIELSGRGNVDRSFVCIGDKYTDGFDSWAEGSKMIHPDNSVYTIAGADKLAFNMLPLAEGEIKEIPLHVKIKTSGKYTLKAFKFNLENNKHKAYLKDNLTGKIEPMNENFEYEFANPSGTDTDRFAIILGDGNSNADKIANKLPLQFNANYEAGQLTLFFKADAETDAQYDILDFSGKTLLQTTAKVKGSKAKIAANLLPGTYLVRMKGKTGSASSKFIVKQ